MRTTAVLILILSVWTQQLQAAALPRSFQNRLAQTCEIYKYNVDKSAMMSMTAERALDNPIRNTPLGGEIFDFYLKKAFLEGDFVTRSLEESVIVNSSEAEVILRTCLRSRQAFLQFHVDLSRLRREALTATLEGYLLIIGSTRNLNLLAPITQRLTPAALRKLSLSLYGLLGVGVLTQVANTYQSIKQRSQAAIGLKKTTPNDSEAPDEQNVNRQVAMSKQMLSDVRAILTSRRKLLIKKSRRPESPAQAEAHKLEIDKIETALRKIP